MAMAFRTAEVRLQNGPAHFRPFQTRPQAARRGRTTSIVFAKAKAGHLHPADLKAYFQRIKLPESLQQERRLGRLDTELLKATHWAHITSIPFENFSLVHPKAKEQDGGRIPLDLPSLVDKLIKRNRGGYCFELNALLAAALRTMGFNLYTAFARVILEPPAANSDEIAIEGVGHHIIIVTLEGKKYLVDGGFGAQQPREPVLLTEDSIERWNKGQAGGHRVRRGVLGSKSSPTGKQPHKEGWYAQYQSASKGWQDIYFFTETEFTPKDFEIANWYMSTSPDIFFTQMALGSLQTKEGRITLRDKRLRIFDQDTLAEEVELSSDDEVAAAAQKYFNITL